MLFLKHLVAAVGALATTVTAAPQTTATNSNDAPVAGFEVAPMEWSVQPTPGKGAFVNVTGTIEEVVAEMTKTNPNFEQDIRDVYKKNKTNIEAEYQTLSAEFRAKASNSTSTALDKRYTLQSRICWNWPNARRGPIWDGIWYLYGVSGQPSLGPGFGRCSRNPYSYTLDWFGNIAHSARMVHDDCNAFDWSILREVTSGQVFWQEGWNVIVRDEEC
ncbi:hypothetical protein QBC44DRAFT_371978 [Cladorrhinum sp. PSN332]|nr:hypothetical protein QBC44DRAFT_371978 [Cladorrhinum sp. PSN332]